MKGKLGAAALLTLAVTLVVSAQFIAQDPGVRPGPASVGGARDGLSNDYLSMFDAVKSAFTETETVSGGLGPRFNGNSCAQCHIQPEVGGSSPAVNPQVDLATDHGARNVVPSFITSTGPVREARFIKNPDGTTDGGVHALYTITGRDDGQSCSLTQPDFATAQRQHNVIFRIPTPVFGLGLVAEIPDSTILANATNPDKKRMGISGKANRSGNDGTVTRFGWKAQNKSLAIFSGEAYNVEMGVTNEFFPNERDETPGCVLNSTPEDGSNLESDTAFQPAGYQSDAVQFGLFSTLSAPPTPATPTADTQAGFAAFNEVGCNLCHTPMLLTGKSKVTGQANVPVNAYSDFLVHNMGQGLSDGVTQGNAGPDEFRTAPLWGVGQRIFFLHDGRTKDLREAIQQHFSAGSEANGVIAKFAFLPPQRKQQLLNFLRSL